MSVCGLLATVTFGTNRLDASRFSSSLDLIEHRGPDDRGVREMDVGGVQVLLGHRRLSIFDPSKAGAQPMLRHDGCSIVFNGEIFNWHELAAELSSLGHEFRSKSDTEVVLAAYAQWGPSCVERFVGFWAMVILDPIRRRLFVSRDRFGIKPLYFAQHEGTWAFASEIKAIWPTLQIEPRIRTEQLARCMIFAQSDDSGDTIYEQVFEVQPATSLWLNLESQELQTRSYWSLRDLEPRELDDEQALDQFQELVEHVAKQWARTDRSFALTLSGGVDSSVVALALSRSGQQGMTAYTSSFPHLKEIDETYYAQRVARHLNMEHRCVQPDLDDLARENRKLTWHQEILFGSGSILVNWCVVKMMQQDGIAAYLTGQGGDEVFLGYERYFVPAILGQSRHPMQFLREIRRTTKNSRLSMKELLGYMIYFKSGRIREARYRWRAKKVFSESFLRALNSQIASIPLDIRRLQRQEICGRQLRRLLRFDDRVCTAHGLESRPMLLDHRLVEFGYQLDVRHKVREGWSKYILRKYLERHGMPEIAWRTHKMGYPAPSYEWAMAWKTDEQLEKMSGIARQGLRWSDVPRDQVFALQNLCETAEVLSWRWASADQGHTKEAGR